MTPTRVEGRHAERIVRMVNSLEADVVAVVGDLVDGTVADRAADHVFVLPASPASPAPASPTTPASPASPRPSAPATGHGD